MKVQELIDDLLAVADPDTEIEWRVVGSAEETVEIWPTQRYYGGEIKTQVDIDAQGEINGVDATSDGKVRVEVWFKVLDFGFYNMDCMDGMKEFPDNYFDLAVVDPPYGDGKLSENSGGVLEQIRPEVRPLQADTSNGRMCDNRTGHGVTRTGGTWASKYTKKSLRGTLPRERSIFASSSASHDTRSSGGAITSGCHRRGASWSGAS